jgi:hypothetical protein
MDALLGGHYTHSSSLALVSCLLSPVSCSLVSLFLSCSCLPLLVSCLLPLFYCRLFLSLVLVSCHWSSSFLLLSSLVSFLVSVSCSHPLFLSFVLVSCSCRSCSCRSCPPYMLEALPICFFVSQSLPPHPILYRTPTLNRTQTLILTIGPTPTLTPTSTPTPTPTLIQEWTSMSVCPPITSKTTFRSRYLVLSPALSLSSSL